MRTNAKNILALLSCVLMWHFLFFFGLLSIKSIKLDVNPDDTKFKHIYIWTHHIYTYRPMTHIIWSQKHMLLKTKDEAVVLF